MSPPLQLGFAGTPPFAVAALDILHSSRHRVSAVYSMPDRPQGRGRQIQYSPVKQRALQLGLPVFQPPSFRTPEALAELKALGLDALVVAAYGLILPEAALAAPRLGSFNIHASLLPRWRGAAPIQRAILAGDADTGITIMRMAAKLDSGPILLRESLAILPTDTSASLQNKLAVLGASLMLQVLEDLAAGKSRETPQSADGVLYAPKVDKAEALLDWGASAAEILRKIRAFNPWPIAETSWRGSQFRIWEAAPAPDSHVSAAPGAVLQVSDRGIDVACGQGCITLTRVQVPGKKPQNAPEFSRAHALADARFGGS
jgi:methionyl-tRNA formyltransferase